MNDLDGHRGTLSDLLTLPDLTADLTLTYKSCRTSSVDYQRQPRDEEESALL